MVEVISTEYGYKKVCGIGIVYHYNHKGELHNPNGPAIEYPSGHKEYYLNGIRHRIDGPAIEYADGRKSYFVKGTRHRTDGPTLEWEDGTKIFHNHGKLHNPIGIRSQQHVREETHFNRD